MVFTRVLIIRA